MIVKTFSLQPFRKVRLANFSGGKGVPVRFKELPTNMQEGKVVLGTFPGGEKALLEVVDILPPPIEKSGHVIILRAVRIRGVIRYWL